MYFVVLKANTRSRILYLLPFYYLCVYLCCVCITGCKIYPDGTKPAQCPACNHIINISIHYTTILVCTYPSPGRGRWLSLCRAAKTCPSAHLEDWSSQFMLRPCLVVLFLPNIKHTLLMCFHVHTHTHTYMVFAHNYIMCSVSVCWEWLMFMMVISINQLWHKTNIW